MEINEWKKLGAKTLDISLELCKNSLEKGVAYSEKSDFHSAIREFTVVIDLFPKLVELTKNLQLPPKMAHESAIMFANISCTAYSGRSLAYTQIGEKEKGNADMIMAEKAKKVKNALTSPPQNENQAMIFETINSQPAQSTTSSDDGVFGDFKYSRIGSEIEIKKYVGTTTSVNIPSRINNLPVTTIGVEAFSFCESLTSIQIPNSVTTIGDAAFRNCESLTSIQIPNSVTTIGVAAFCGCKSLTSIQIPNSVTTIGMNVFSDCHSLTSIQIPDSVSSIGEGSFFYCKSLKSIQIPNSVTSIDDGAFSSCESLTSIQIPESTILGKDVFKFCKRSLRISRVPIAEPIVETPKITVDSHVNHKEKKAKKSELSKFEYAMGCSIYIAILYGIYWVIKSIWNFLFG